MVTIRGVSGVTPTSGQWSTTQTGDTTTMTASGPATARIMTAGGNLIEVDVPAGKDVELRQTGVDVVVIFNP